MKKISLFLIMMCMAVFANAQKFRTNVIDKFTGDTVQVTSLETLFVSYEDSKAGIGFDHRLEFVIERTGSKFTLYADMILPDRIEFDDNSALIFLLDNGEKVTLKPNILGRHCKRMGNGFMTENNYNLSREDIQKFKAHIVTDVRVQYVGDKYDKVMKGNRQTVMQRVCSLF